jgi:glycosyltransferase involved in cell wall biosynthesis
MLPVHYSSGLGGAEYQAALLCDALCETNRFEVFYLCRRGDPNYTHPGYTLRIAGGNTSSSLVALFLAARKILTELKRIQPDIIYQNVGGLLTGVAGYYARKHKVKFVWHIASDDDVVPQWNSNIRQALWGMPERLLLNYGIRRATVIAAQTRYQADLLQKKFGISTRTFIPIGHPLPENPVVKNGPITVLWVANLKPLKRPELFVRLAQKFRGREDVRFIMVGREGWGGWFDRLRDDMSRLPNFSYLGKLPQEEVNQWLARGHILVNTSRYEGFSNTFVQAWLRKVPVVSLTVDPDRLLVTQKIGFHSGTFEQLCTDVGTLIDNQPLRDAMGERACDYARAHHSVETMTSRALQLLS